MELYNEISQPSVVKIISKKQLFFKAKLRLKNYNSLIRIAKILFFWPPGCDFFFFATRFNGNKHHFFLGLVSRTAKCHAAEACKNCVI